MNEFHTRASAPMSEVSLQPLREGRAWMIDRQIFAPAMSFLVLLLIGTMFAQEIKAQPEFDAVVKQLAEWENTANNERVRPEWQVQLKQYEIPIESVWVEGLENLPPEVAEFLVITKNGRRYLRVCREINGVSERMKHPNLAPLLSRKPSLQNPSGRT